MNLMSNISKKILAPCIILIMILSGCEKDFLETKIDNRVTQKNIDANYQSILNFAIAPYSFLNPISNGFSAIDGNLFAVCADEAVQTVPNDFGANLIAQGTYNAYNSPDTLYYLSYMGIRAANYFLENFKEYKTLLARNRDTISDHQSQYKLDVANIESYIAEVHALRAYYYYELIKRYGDVPLVTKALSVNENTQVARTDFSKIIEFIVSEIDSVKTKLPNEFVAAYKGRINKGVAITIKMKALMLNASPLHNPTNIVTRWQDAASAAHEVIALNKYTLGSYATLFYADNTAASTESIWEVRLGTTNDFEKRNYPLSTPGGKNEITPSHNLVDAYEYISTPTPDSIYLNRDPRLGYSIAVNNTKWTNRYIQIWKGGKDDYTKDNVSRTGYYLKKFLNDNLNLERNDSKQRAWIVFRYADVLLNYAEAMNEAYGPDNNNGFSLTAREAINQVRSRAGVAMPNVVAANQTEMRSKIKHERRIELAFEGHRYWDLLRWKDAETELNKKITGVVAVKNSDNSYSYSVQNVATRVFVAPKMYYFPLPWDEISKSGGILTQNPGW
jgi:hypothetical protein